jgi:hypothetical protein
MRIDPRARLKTIAGPALYASGDGGARFRDFRYEALP